MAGFDPDVEDESEGAVAADSLEDVYTLRRIGSYVEPKDALIRFARFYLQQPEAYSVIARWEGNSVLERVIPFSVASIQLRNSLD